MTVVPPVRTISIGPRTARAVAIGLTAYGVIGVVLLTVAFLVGGSAVDRIERLSVTLDGTLRAAAGTARSSVSALDNLDVGVGQGSSAAADAGRLADQAAVTSAQLSAAMGLSILGAQPLLPMAASFNDLTTQLRSLSGDLRSIGSALETSGRDLDGVRANMGELATRLEGLNTGGSSATIAPGSTLRLAFLGLLLWLAVPAVGALLIGIALLSVVRRW